MTEKLIVSYHRVSPTIKDRVSTEGVRLSHSEVQINIHKSMLSSIEICDKAAHANGERIDKIYTDEYVSGKNQDYMLKFKQMMDDAKDGKIHKVYIRRVNRFGRNLIQSMQAMVDLDKMGVTIIAVENGIDTSKPFGKSLMMLFVEFAEQERESWEESRTLGIEKAKAAGVRFGPPRKELDVESLRQLRLMSADKRMSWKALERLFGVSTTTMIARLKDAGYWDADRRTVM